MIKCFNRKQFVYTFFQACSGSPIEYILNILRKSSDEKFDEFCIGLLETKQEEVVERFLLSDGEITFIFKLQWTIVT